MTTFLLIRHAAHELVAHSLTGHLRGIHLSAEGQAQAHALAGRLAYLPIAAVYSSPLERAIETAEPLARVLHQEICREEGLIEVDYGEWAGKRFDALSDDKRWQHWNSFRSAAPLPQGGLMLEVQARAVATLVRLQRSHRDQVVAVVGHCDVLKAAVAHFLGVPLDLFQRIEISPASVSVLALHDWGARLLRLNDTGNLDLPAS
jgi:probable phosphoglycerate mutase